MLLGYGCAGIVAERCGADRRPRTRRDDGRPVRRKAHIRGADATKGSHQRRLVRRRGHLLGSSTTRAARKLEHGWGRRDTAAGRRCTERDAFEHVARCRQDGSGNRGSPSQCPSPQPTSAPTAATRRRESLIPHQRVPQVRVLWRSRYCPDRHLAGRSSSERCRSRRRAPQRRRQPAASFVLGARTTPLSDALGSQPSSRHHPNTADLRRQRDRRTTPDPGESCAGCLCAPPHRRVPAPDSQRPRSPMQPSATRQ